MATTFPRVSPGDVITAAEWNQVLSALEDLYSQIGAVSTTAVAITGFMPPGTVKVGDQITVLGRNFQYSIGAQSLFFGGVQVNSFLVGSSDTQLVVNVPQLTNLPDQGESITVTAYNRTTSATAPLTVAPAPTSLSGGVPVSAVPFTGTANAGQTSDFAYVVTSNLGVTRSVNISATIVPSTLQGSIQLLNGPGGQPLGQLSLTPNVSVPVTVALALPAGTTGSFTLTVDAIDILTGSNLGSSAVSTYVVGQASQTDPNIQFGALRLTNFSPGQGNALSGSTITLPANSFATVQIVTSFKAAAEYSVTATLTNASGWQVTMVTPPPGQVLNFTQGVPPSTTVSFTVQTLASPAGGGQLQIQAQTQGQSKVASLGLNLATS
jgi:hypothetical protein